MKKLQNRKSKFFYLRRIILLLAALSVVSTIGTGIWYYIAWNAAAINTADKVNFDRPLPIPALAASTISDDGFRTFSLALQTGQTEFFEGIQTDTWGVNGSYLGPTLRAKRGEKVRVNVKNELPEASSIHWHGMHVPAEMDGGPHQPIEVETTWSPEWEIKQPTASLWYHPHPHGETEKHVYMGVSGMFLIDDDSEAQTKLPNKYGIDDIPVIVQDKAFDTNKQLVRKNEVFKSIGTLGDEVVVNGARTPHLNVTSDYVRLRLLNGSTARIYNFGLTNGEDIQLIASDGGLLERPVSLKRIMLSPGERAEILVKMTPDETTELRSYPNELLDRFSGGDDSLDIMQLRAASQLSTIDLPESYTAIERLDETEATQTRKFNLTSASTINNQRMDMNRVDFDVKKNDIEIWEIENTHGSPHNFHVHDVQFQVISVDGAPPPPALSGWKDTVIVLPNQTVRLIMQFSDYADDKFSYMFHCHLLRHEDDGMMGQFMVIDEDMEPVHRLKQSHQH